MSVCYNLRSISKELKGNLYKKVRLRRESYERLFKVF